MFVHFYIQAIGHFIIHHIMPLHFRLILSQLVALYFETVNERKIGCKLAVLLRSRSVADTHL